MPDPFRTRIRQSIDNPVLQAALDANAERRIQVRQEAFASLKDPQALRRQAHQVRSEVIAHLDDYVEKFIKQVQANGVTVHRAANAQEAVQIILEIAAQNQASLIAKSKSMVSEEIHLNHEVEKAGLRAVETDLGEYIVQLRGERPAHIITPAVHLRRQEVGQTFAEKLGIPLTDDIPTLTTVARKTLRQVFLDADIGISGVNFGVAETGTLCVLTNECNGRMVTTLPEVHIALMGLERLVPTLDDLALMLALLPRSATGQKLTVYTSLIHSPRQPGDADGPAQRHLVLLDNGRRALRDTPLVEALYCIRCGACLNACPIFRELGGHAYTGVHGCETPYPGPIGSVISPGLFGQGEFSNLARASSLCGACKEACPVDIDLPGLLLRIRAGDVRSISGIRRPSAESNSPGSTPPASPQSVPWYLSLGLKAFTWVAVHPGRFGWAQKAAGFFGRLASPRSGWIHLPAMTGWGFSKDFPRPAQRSFSQQMLGRQAVAKKHAADVPVQNPSPNAKSQDPSPSLPEGDCRQVFARELAALGGHFTLCTEGEAAGQVLQVLNKHGIRSVLAWSSPDLPENLLEDLRKSGVTIHHTPNPEIKAGLTGALAGSAETGSIVIASGPGRLLAASLTPEIHLAILKADRLYPDLGEMFRFLHSTDGKEINKTAALALVSGPSRTADIEMTLTIGVHGPKEIYVICTTE